MRLPVPIAFVPLVFGCEGLAALQNIAVYTNSTTTSGSNRYFLSLHDATMTSAQVGSFEKVFALTASFTLSSSNHVLLRMEFKQLPVPHLPKKQISLKSYIQNLISHTSFGVSVMINHCPLPLESPGTKKADSHHCSILSPDRTYPRPSSTDPCVSY